MHEYAYCDVLTACCAFLIISCACEWLLLICSSRACPYHCTRMHDRSLGVPPGLAVVTHDPCHTVVQSPVGLYGRLIHRLIIVLLQGSELLV